MRMLTIEEFCVKNGAGRNSVAEMKRRFASCHDAWKTGSPTGVVWMATRPGVLTLRELRLFAVRSVQPVLQLLSDPRSIKALEVAGRHATGDATDEELAQAHNTAAGVEYGLKFSAAYAAHEAVCAASCPELSTTVCDKAFEAAFEAARAAARAGGKSAMAFDKAVATQAEYLRLATVPNFTTTDEPA